MICTCGHFDKEHRFLDRTVDNILISCSQNKDLEIRYSPDQIEPLGIVLLSDNKYYTWDEAKIEVGKAIKDCSTCKKFRCQCRFFKADNLRYLEMKEAGEI